MEMEFARSALAFNQFLILFFIVSLISSFIFKNKRELVSVIKSLIFLVIVNYFVLIHKDFMFDHFPKQSYGVLVMVLLMYFVFFRDVFEYVKLRKSERVTTDK